MNNVLVIGSGGHAKVVVDAIEKQGQYRILGFVDSYKEVGQVVAGYPVLGGDQDIEMLYRQHAGFAAVVALGDNSLRCRVAQEIERKGIPLATVVHPSAQIGKGVALGAGTVVMAGAVINSDTTVGRHCIVNTRSSIDHDGAVADFASIAPGATLGGGCRIEQGAAISIGAVVRHNVSVGRHTIVGAGAVVLTDCDQYSVYYGVPAKKIRSRDKNEKYL